jgi:lambda repressor-like predicted transcriptional regulator
MFPVVQFGPDIARRDWLGIEQFYIAGWHPTARTPPGNGALINPELVCQFGVVLCSSDTAKALNGRINALEHSAPLTGLHEYFIGCMKTMNVPIVLGANIPDNCKDRHRRVWAGLVGKGTNLRAWCRVRGVKHQNARKALDGKWTGPKVAALVAELLCAAGVDV